MRWNQQVKSYSSCNVATGQYGVGEACWFADGLPGRRSGPCPGNDGAVTRIDTRDLDKMVTFFACATESDSSLLESTKIWSGRHPSLRSYSLTQGRHPSLPYTLCTVGIPAYPMPARQASQPVSRLFSGSLPRDLDVPAGGLEGGASRNGEL